MAKEFNIPVKKRITAAVLSFFIIASFILTMPYSVAETSKDGNWDYTKNGSTVTINKYKGANTVASLTIPETIETYTVTNIGNDVFTNCTNLQSVTIPACVKTDFTKTNMFRNCTALTSITAGDWRYSVSSSSKNAQIAKYNGLAQTLEIPAKIDVYSITGIGDNAFYGCSNLTGITTPSSLTSVGSSAFYGCSKLTSINMPYVTSVGDSAFSHCTALTGGSSISMPIITSISNSMFSYCSNLTSFIVPNTVKSIGDNAFDECSELNSINLNAVESIGVYAFWNCKKLPGINIPNSVKTISTYAFKGCESIQSITIPASVTSLSPSAFDNCKSLAKISVNPSNPNYIDIDGVLHSKNGTQILRYPEGKPSISYSIVSSVTSIGNNAFQNCGNLSDIIIPNGLLNIDSQAFLNCANLSLSIVIPSSVKNISQDAFDSCTSLTNITVDKSNTNYADIDGVLYNKSGTELIRCPEGKESNLFPVPACVTSIGHHAFNSCRKIISVDIPDSVKSISNYAFTQCSNLISVDMPGSIENIGSNAFYSCTNLTDLIIPSSVTSVSDHAFAYCSALLKITIPSSVATIENYAFYNCSKLEDVTIEDGVKKIDRYAFNNCSSLPSITIPKSVTQIVNDKLFQSCTKLAQIIVNEENQNYTDVNGVLYNKNETELIRYPEGKTDYAYQIPNSVTSIARDAFLQCVNLEDITIPDTVTRIDYGAFYSCRGLTSITIPSSVANMGNNMFNYCTALKKVYIKNPNTIWGSMPFSYCYVLKDVYIKGKTNKYGNIFNGAKTHLLDRLSITPPEKTKYIIGGKLDKTGFSAVVCYKDGEIETDYGTLTPADCTFSGFDSASAGTKTVAVTYAPLSLTGTFDVEVVEKKLIGIKVTKLPDKTVYKINEPLDAKGLEVVAKYNYSPDEPITDYDLSDLGSTTAGTKTITVSHKAMKDMKDTFDVEVERTLTGIVVTKKPDKLIYKLNDSLDTKGLEVAAKYDDGTSMVLNDTDYVLDNGFDSAMVGTKTITVTYEGKTADFTVGVTKTLTKISVTKKPDKLTYKINEELDKTGLEVTAYYDDGTHGPVTGYTLGDLDSKTIGEKTIAVTYLDMTDNFEVEVIKSLTGIRVAKAPNKLTYKINEELDAKGLKVMAEYDDGSDKTVTDYTLGGFESKTLGEKTITVTYNGKTADFTVGVIKTLTGIRVTKAPDKLTYKINENLDTKGLKVTADYDDGSSEAINDYTLKGFKSKTVGEKTITVTYDGKTADFTVGVVKTLTGIRVAKTPDKLTYKINENLDTKGLKVTADYDDGSSEVINDYTLKDFDSAAAGVKSVIVAYAGKTASFPVNVELQMPPTGDVGYPLAALTISAAAVLLILRKKRNG